MFIHNTWGFDVTPPLTPPPTMSVDVAYEDFLSLQSDEVRHDVRCRRCHGQVWFWDNPRDPSMGTYECTGQIFNSLDGSYVLCGQSAYVCDVENALSFALNALFYVALPFPTEKLHKLCTEEYVGTTAYTHLREATEDEHWQAQKDRLERARETFRRKRS